MLELLRKVKIIQIDNGIKTEIEDTVVSEYYLTLFINGRKQVTFSCIPEYLEELVLGYLISEGIVDEISEVEDIKVSADECKAEVKLKKDLRFQVEEESDFTYGRQHADYNAGIVQRRRLKCLEDSCSFSIAEILRQFERFSQESQMYKKTHAVHRAVLCKGDEVLCAANDVSRHNTIDKVVGMASKRQIELSQCYLITSGRVPKDIAAKAIRSGIQMLVARSVATYEAIELARRCNLTLVGRVGDGRMKIYSGVQRLTD
ncbi:MAG: formate dehydrogenase accessory sulfurtransferase FdhD [Thermacetogeniaceae bacterium]